MKKAFSLVLISLILVLSFAGCGKGKSPLVGKWAYIHDDSTEVLRIKSNGKANFEGIDYTYTTDDSFITLTNRAGEVTKMRYVVEKDGFLLYKTTVYTRSDAIESSSLVGLWNGKEVNKWTFEFTESGEFNEDGYFPGYYTVDEADNSIKLIYNDHFEDTTCYFSLNGDELSIEYPWKMVTVK